MSWVLLFIAGLCEVAWALFLKSADGFTKPVPTVASGFLMLSSFGLLALALREIPIGTGYAIWTGIGVVGTAIGGVVIFGEPKDLAKIASLLLIVGGMIGLRLASR